MKLFFLGVLLLIHQCSNKEHEGNDNLFYKCLNSDCLHSEKLSLRIDSTFSISYSAERYKSKELIGGKWKVNGDSFLLKYDKNEELKIYLKKYHGDFGLLVSPKENWNSISNALDSIMNQEPLFNQILENTDFDQERKVLIFNRIKSRLFPQYFCGRSNCFDLYFLHQE